MKLKATSKEKDKRLDHFLVENYPEKSRSYWQKEVKAGRVLVNAKVVPPHLFLKGGENIEITKAQKHESTKSKKQIPKLEIIDETADYIIINKPVGLLVHPTDISKEATLVDALVKHFPAIKKVGNDKSRPGIVHRLDRLVSGVMVVAKTPAMYEHLKKSFGDRKVKKEYLALVHGPLTKDTDTISFSISRSRRGGRMAAKPEGEEGKPATTSYDVLERFSNMTYVSAKPETGRTHQIRAHFHAIGHPIIGDPLYRTRNQKAHKARKRESAKAEATRIMLHAFKLSFSDLQGKTKIYEVPPPADFSNFIKNQTFNSLVSRA